MSSAVDIVIVGTPPAERLTIAACIACGARRLAREADELRAEERELADRARLIANVRARPGHEETTMAALQALLTTIR